MLSCEQLPGFQVYVVHSCAGMGALGSNHLQTAASRPRHQQQQTRRVASAWRVSGREMPVKQDLRLAISSAWWDGSHVDEMKQRKPGKTAGCPVDLLQNANTMTGLSSMPVAFTVIYVPGGLPGQYTQQTHAQGLNGYPGGLLGKRNLLERAERHYYPPGTNITVSFKPIIVERE
jgi:hypothetical protein